ncbi:MAG: hypothetical protein ACLQU4_10795 [Limisphaerales bacterium]
MKQFCKPLSWPVATLSPLCGERAGREAITMLLVLLLAGCVSKKQAELQAHQAYMAGQTQAAKQWQAEKPPQVVVQGPVSNHVIPWTEGLTLAQAIVDANYTGFMTPKFVRVVRNGQLIETLKGVDLLHHEDVPLEAGDIVNIVP